MSHIVAELRHLPTWRLRVAIFLSFFPCAFLFPFGYPTREVITLLAWIVAFPSLLTALSLLLLPLFLSNSYGYFAFNLFSLLATLGVCTEASKQNGNGNAWDEFIGTIRLCIFSTIIIAVTQALDSTIWLSFFPDVGISEGRGAGFRTEPSLLAAPLAIYLSALVFRLKDAVGSRRYGILGEALAVIFAFLVLTRSLSVLITVVCFAPVLGAGLRYALPVGMLSLGAAAAVFVGRLRGALSDASGSVLYLLTLAVGSWRSVPDILILTNFKEYLLPGRPSQLRDHLNTLAMAWLPGFEWLDNTYSTFSACASTLGLLVTAGIFAIGAVLGWKHTRSIAGMRFTWLLLYIASWFFFPKYEACGWISLAMLVAVPNAQVETIPAKSRSFLARFFYAACQPARDARLRIFGHL
ncbi:MAG: hypothetical protein WAK33_15190 [Silvibacterium sp.]